MATTQEKWQEIANRGLQDQFDPATRAKFDEAVRRQLVSLPQQEEPTDGTIDSGTTGVPDDTPFFRPPAEGLERLKGFGEAGLAIASGIVGEIAGGVTGLATAVAGNTPQGSGAAVSKGVREAIQTTPKSEFGQEVIAGIGEFIAPAAELFSDLENLLGDSTLEATGSPVLATLAKTTPTIVMELTGLAAAKGAQRLAGDAIDAKVAKGVEEAAPSTEQLFDTSREVFKEIDDLGVSIKPKAYRRLVTRLQNSANKLGVDRDVTPKAAKALGRFKELIGKRPVTLSELDTVRTVARNAASDLNKADAGIGKALIDTVDDFLDTAGSNALRQPAGVSVGPRYKVARDLWGRGRRSEVIAEAFDKAGRQASGFENGVRTQFRQILNSKTQRKFFSAEERAVMDKVVKGGKAENLARFFGRFAPTEGGAHNLLSSGVGIAGGAAIGGAPGAIAVPIIGLLSRKLASRMTENNAKFADEFIRAGKDARKITATYIDNTPKAERSAAELSELLMDPGIDLSTVKTAIGQDAARIASQQRTGAAVGGVLAPEEE